MFKRDITYETFDDPPQTITETFYFNLTRTEALDIYLGRNNLEEVIQTMVKSDDRKGMVDEFKALIHAAYGVKSDDGKRFIKIQDGKRLVDDFIESAAYDILFYEMMTVPKRLEEFLMGIMPREVAAEMAKSNQNVFDFDKVQPLPQPPLPPAV